MNSLGAFTSSVDPLVFISGNPLIDFFDARDLFLGYGVFVHYPDISRGLSQLSACCNDQLKQADPIAFDEAIFICSLFSTPPSFLEVIETLHSCVENNPIAMCYIGTLTRHTVEGLSLLKKAAHLGHPLANSILFYMNGGRSQSFNGSMFRFSFDDYSNSKTRERYGLYLCGTCFYPDRCSNGNYKDKERALDFYKQSMLLGCPAALSKFARLSFDKYGNDPSCNDDDPFLYLWLGRAAQRGGDVFIFTNRMSDHVYLFREGKGYPSVLFMIGRMLLGHVTFKEFIFGRYRTEEDFDNADKVLSLYHISCDRSRDSIICWLLCAKRLHLYSDVSRLIASWVWNDRASFMPKYSETFIYS